jgi:hypothetical protein
MELKNFQVEEAINLYDYPKRAEAIWKECLPDINRLGCYDGAYNILSDNRCADSLDVKLSRLISKRDHSKAR